MIERLLQARVSIRVLILVILVCIVGAIAFGTVVRVAASGARVFGVAGDIALELASIPKNFRKGMQLVFEGEKKDLASADRRFGSDAGFKFNTPNGAGYPDEYLLLSRYDADRRRSVVELVDMAANKVLYRWIPDFAGIVGRSQLQSNLVDMERDQTPERSRVMHPLLLPEGDLVFQNTAPLVRSGPCGEIRWMLDSVYHHSIELHSAGGFWVERFMEPPSIENVTDKFKEDVIVHVSVDGKVLFEKSVPQLMIENGLGRHVYGQDFYTDDPLHMNDIQEALFDTEYWKAGDVFLSLRNISAIVLYRPSTNKVVWVKQGPWVNQHDVDILDDHRIVVFNNNRYNYPYKDGVFGVNDIMIYDFATDQVTSPFLAGMEKHDVRTISEGRSEVYPNGDVFVEESNYGRLLRLSPSGDIVWQYVNRAKNGEIYRMNWTRLVPPDLAKAAMDSLADVSCAQTR